MRLRRNYINLSTEPDYIFSLGAGGDLDLNLTDTLRLTNDGNV